MKININENFGKIKQNYLFSEIATRVKTFKKANPDASIIKMGIGDVTLPLPKPAVAAMEAAAREMGVKESFRGYPPEYGPTDIAENGRQAAGLVFPQHALMKYHFAARPSGFGRSISPHP